MKQNWQFVAVVIGGFIFTAIPILVMAFLMFNTNITEALTLREFIGLTIFLTAPAYIVSVVEIIKYGRPKQDNGNELQK